MSRKLLVALLMLVAASLVAGGNVRASPDTFTVDSTGDAPDSDTADGVCDDGTGNCTLRAAIEQANATPGADTIAFNIPGPGPHTISPGAALPTITAPVTIDGTTQPDFSGTPIIEVDGIGAGPGVRGFTITAGSSTVKGLVINRFGGDGIRLSGNGGNVIERNYVGTDVTGTADLGNFENGISIRGPSNTIGGATASGSNVISGNGVGVEIYGSSATGNQVLGNYIGTDVTGTARVSNSYTGVVIQGASNNSVGGTAAGARNVISANLTGISIQDWYTAATGNVVLGNHIGTDVTGTAALGNGLGGIVISDASGNSIGATTVGAGNVISANGRGVVIKYANATGNVVLGNYIGTNLTGTARMGNSYDGVFISGSNNTVGGTASGAANTIAFNGGDGIHVGEGTATSNTIRRNPIHSNGGKGIENINGGNTELSPPVIDSVGSASGHTDPKCYPCTVEVFSDDEDEGRIYHGSTTTNDDLAGTWSYPGTVTGPNITATITDASGNTSEFSAPIPYSPAVGGIAELPPLAEASAGEGGARADGLGWSTVGHAALAGGLAAAVLAAVAVGWYARRRWLG